MPRPLFLLRLLTMLFVLLPGVAMAQSVTKGAIFGTAVDTGGSVIPGVLITITSENMMGTKQAESDPDGKFRFNELPPGNYDLTAEKAGFARYSKPNLPVSAGRVTQVSLELPLATAAEEIVVEETRPTIDTNTAQRGSVLTKEFLERIPAGRSYQSAVQMAVGVTGGSNANVAGASYNENTYLLDGVNITDPVTGTFSVNFNFEAIEQLEVLISAFDPEYGYNLGGVISVVTQTGGNTLEFNSGVYVTNGSWSPRLDTRYASDGLELAPTDFDSRYEIYLISLQISGPIIRDKAWFIASYQHSRTLIANVGIDLPRDFDGHFVFGKVTFQPSSSHRFTILGQTDPSTIDNLDQGDRFVEPAAQYRQTQGGYVVSLQWDWYMSPEMYLETKASLQKSFIEVYGVPCTHDKALGYNPCLETELENSHDFVTPGRAGINNAFDSENFPYFYFDDRWSGAVLSKFSLLQIQALGTHDLKAGVEFNYNTWDQTVGYNGNLLFYDLNELAYNPDTLTNYYWLEFTAPYRFKATAQHFGAFLQDAWKPIENLTFRYGLRYDRQVTRDDQGRPVVDANLWGPRFTSIWDPWGNAKTKLVGSFGRFNDGGRLSVASYLSQSGVGQKLYLGEAFGIYTNEASNDYFYLPNENTNRLIDDMVAPRSDEFMVGVERELIQDVAASIYFTGKFTRYVYAFDELNYLWDEDGYQVIGTTDGSANSIYRLRTPSIARRDYFRTDFGLNRNWADRWQAFANYSYTVSKGTVQNSPSAFLQVPQEVQYYINGNLGTDIRHDVTAGAVWDIPDDPWTTSLGLRGSLESGYPITRYYSTAFYGGSSVLKDTVGTYGRTQTAWDLSLLIQQAIPVRKGKLKGTFQIDNLTNNRVGELASITSDNRWYIYSRQSAIRFQVGGEYEF